MHITGYMIALFLVASILVTLVMVIISALLFFTVPFVGLMWPFAVLAWLLALVILGVVVYFLGGHTSPAFMKLALIVVSALTIVALLIGAFVAHVLASVFLP